MDCSLGRQINPFCYIFSLSCLLLPVCMWWRDVISAHGVETSDNSHYSIPVWAAFTARTWTPWIWKHPNHGLIQKNISADAAGVGKHHMRSGKEQVPGCWLMLSTKLRWCRQACRSWGLTSCGKTPERSFTPLHWKLLAFTKQFVGQVCPGTFLGIPYIL